MLILLLSILLIGKITVRLGPFKRMEDANGPAPEHAALSNHSYKGSHDSASTRLFGERSTCANQNSRPRVLVTGATGMIGSYVVKQLISEDKYEVYCLIRYRSDLSNLAGTINRVSLIYGDVLDAGRMRKVVDSSCPKIVFHFAAQAINGISYNSAELTIDTNIKGTFNVLEAIRSAQLTRYTRFVLAGSSTEYGRTADTWRVRFRICPMSPVSPRPAKLLLN